MAAPIKSAKQTVNLAVAGARGSRIRRNPPPAPRKEPVLDREDREKISVTVGIVVFTFALVVLVAAIGAYAGWSPREYEIHYRMD